MTETAQVKLGTVSTNYLFLCTQIYKNSTKTVTSGEPLENCVCHKKCINANALLG